MKQPNHRSPLHELAFAKLSVILLGARSGVRRSSVPSAAATEMFVQMESGLCLELMLVCPVLRRAIALVPSQISILVVLAYNILHLGGV